MQPIPDRSDDSDKRHCAGWRLQCPAAIHAVPLDQIGMTGLTLPKSLSWAAFISGRRLQDRVLCIFRRRRVWLVGGAVSAAWR